MKALVHWLHWNGFSPVCILIWAFSLFSSEKHCHINYSYTDNGYLLNESLSVFSDELFERKTYHIDHTDMASLLCVFSYEFLADNNKWKP